MNEPRRIPIHRSLNRPALILGGERDLVLMTMVISVLIAFTASSLIQLAVADVFWLTVHYLLVQMASRDPLMSRVYMRHVKYNAFYPACAGLEAIVPRVGEWKD